MQQNCSNLPMNYSPPVFSVAQQHSSGLSVAESRRVSERTSEELEAIDTHVLQPHWNETLPLV